MRERSVFAQHILQPYLERLAIEHYILGDLTLIRERFIRWERYSQLAFSVCKIGQFTREGPVQGVSGGKTADFEGVGLVGVGSKFDVHGDLKLKGKVLKEEFSDVEDFEVEYDELGDRVDTIADTHLD